MARLEPLCLTAMASWLQVGQREEGREKWMGGWETLQSSEQASMLMTV